MFSKNRYRLLLFDHQSKRATIRLLFLLAIAVGLLNLSNDNHPLLMELRSLLLAGTAVLLALLFYFAIWLRRTAVLVKPKHLVIRGAISSLEIPYNDILSITPTQIAKQYPIEELGTYDLNRLGELYERPCAMINLRQRLSTPKYLFPRFLFTPNQHSLLLIVSDWVSLSKDIEAARTRWQKKYTQPPAPIIKTSEEALPQDAATLLVLYNNLDNQQHLTRLFSKQYHLHFSTEAIDALQQARRIKPDLILCASSPNGMTALSFMEALRKQEHLDLMPLIILGPRQDETLCLELMEAGANDYLIWPFQDLAMSLRVRNWLAIQKDRQELHKRNEVLQMKTLDQMVELMRRGELINFLPTAVAQQIMSGQINGQIQPLRRQKVTVLFIDIVGFTDLTGRLKPEILSELLNEYLREMTAVAIQYNGTVDKFIGDAVMVLFGAPRQKDEKEQVWEAAQAALAMLRAVEGINLIWRSHLPRDLQVRVGFNLGYCTAGVFGNEMLQSYTVVGSAVNIAARLQSAAQPSTCYTSVETYRYIQNRARGRGIGELQLKGVNHPVDTYQLIALKQAKPAPRPQKKPQGIV